MEDTARFTRLVEPVLADLQRFARRLARDPIRAEDLLQQSLLQGLRKIEQLASDGAFRVWQSRILYRTHLNQLRRPPPMPVDPLDPTAVASPPAPPSADPHLRLLRRRASGRLADALDHLPADQREAVWLIDGQGFRYAEAATILGCAPGTVASRVARGRQTLQRSLRDLARDHGVVQ